MMGGVLRRWAASVSLPADRGADLLHALVAASIDPDACRDLDRWAPEDAVAMARRHRLSSVIGSLGSPALTPRLAAELRRHALVSCARNLAYEQRLGEVVAELEKVGVRVLVLKGLAYERTLYRVPGSREMSDIDILIEPERRTTALQALYRLGYHAKVASPGFDGPDFHEITLRREGELDLHTALVPPHRSLLTSDIAWQGAVPIAFDGFSCLQLGPMEACLFHAVHMAIHHFQVPAIALVDLHHLLGLCGDLRELQARASALRCRRALVSALALYRAWVPDAVARGHGPDTPAPWTARVLRSFRSDMLLPRWRQIVIKFEHFDTPGHAVRFTLAFGRRLAREAWLGRKSVEERLGI
jgi:hypothetical protein